MADTKITGLLSPQVTTNPATDVLPIVNIADTLMASSGSTRKITVNQLLGAGGTATLASATITGDLTVNTNVLKVDSTNDRVGIGTATPSRPLDIVGSFQSSLGWVLTGTPAGLGAATRYIGGASTTDSWYYNSVSGGSHIWAFGESTAMTLNSTGLGVGRTPSAYKFEVLGNAQIIQSNFTDVALRISQGASTSGNTGQILFTDSSGTIGNITSYGSAYGGGVSGALGIGTGGTDRLLITATGNVGVGVTPSAWGSASYSVAALQNAAGAFWNYQTSIVSMVQNAFYNNSGQYIYKNNGFASEYYQSSGQHIWRTVASGTAGNTITFTQAMTLDASGRLLVGKVASNFATVGSEIKANGSFTSTQSDSTNGSTAWDTYSTGASAYRFYVGMAGTVFATNTTISAISDARFKENIQDIDVGLGAILALKPRKFDWKAGKGKNIKGDRGFIAQEFEQVFPNLVDEWRDNAPEGEAPYKSVRQDLIPVLVKAIQELTARVQTLEAR